MARRLTLLLLPCLAACTSPERVTLDQAALPAGVLWAAALGIDEGGGIAGATGLAPVEGGRVLAFGDIAGAVGFEVVGYTRADLASLGVLPSEVTLRASPLSEADPRGARLPPASWRAAFDADGIARAEVPDARVLTAAWLPDCPRRVEPGQGVTASCAPKRCTMSASQVGCTLRIDTATCGFGELEAEVGPTGEVTARISRSAGQCVESPRAEGVALALACTGGEVEACTVEVHTSSAPPPLAVEAVELAPGLPAFSESFSIRPPIGYLTGLVVVDDAVMVTRNADRAWRWDECPPERRGVLDRIDAETLAVTTSTAPSCIVRTARDPLPGARGLVFLTGGESPRIGRIGADGAVGASVPLVVDRGRGHLPIQLLAVTTPRPRLFVALTVGFADTGTTPPPRGATLVELDAVTLAQVTSTILDERVELLGAGLDGEPLMVGDRVDDLYTVSPEGRPAGHVPLWTVCSGDFRIKPAALVAHGPSRALVIPALDDDSPAAYVLDGDQRCRRAALPTGPAGGTGATTWPAQPSQVLLGVMRGFRGGVALIDPAGARFVGGVLDVGHGPLDLLQADARGSVWALLPWTGTVVRIRAR